jgi:hypothetical protein
MTQLQQQVLGWSLALAVAAVFIGALAYASTSDLTIVWVMAIIGLLLAGIETALIVRLSR